MPGSLSKKKRERWRQRRWKSPPQHVERLPMALKSCLDGSVQPPRSLDPMRPMKPPGLSSA